LTSVIIVLSEPKSEFNKTYAVGMLQIFIKSI
jgi:hypothetical protein